MDYVDSPSVCPASGSGDAEHIPDGVLVTPEMAEAGALAMTEYEPRWDTLEDGAIRIFDSMIRAKRKASEPLPCPESESSGQPYSNGRR